MKFDSLQLSGRTWWRVAKKHLTRIPLLIWFNSLTLFLLGVLSVYAKVESKGRNIERLFSDPFDQGIPYLGFLTGISEILWCAVITICLFTSVLPQLRRSTKRFLTASALLLAVLFFDDRFRLTLMLSAYAQDTHIAFKIVKFGIYALYGSLFVLYGIKFWQKIRRTPYLPLVVSFFLFAFSSVADLTPMPSEGAHAMLEDGSKLLGLINLTLYFWHVCQLEVQQAFKR